MNRYLIALPLLFALSLTVACNGDNDADPSPTAAASATSAATATAAPASPTTQPTTPAATATATPGAFAGSTDPVTITPNPDPPIGAAQLVDVRVGAHDEEGGFDRIVFEFDAAIPPGSVQYVDSAAHCGSGFPVDDLAGSAILEIAFDSANAHNQQGQPTISAKELDGPGNSILEARQTCDFEANVNWVVGVDGEKPFRVQIVSSPPRVVVDVQH